MSFFPFALWIDKGKPFYACMGSLLVSLWRQFHLMNNKVISMTWKTFLVMWKRFIVNSTSSAHVLPSLFNQQVLYYATLWAWNRLVHSMIFYSECREPVDMRNFFPFTIFSWKCMRMLWGPRPPTSWHLSYSSYNGMQSSQGGHYIMLSQYTPNELIKSG